MSEYHNNNVTSELGKRVSYRDASHSRNIDRNRWDGAADCGEYLYPAILIRKTTYFYIFKTFIPIAGE